MGKDIYDLCITIPFPSEEEAIIAYKTLKVDEEPKRAAVEKHLELDGSQFIV